jgi:hypothetical protein
MSLQPGAMVSLRSRPDSTYQVVNVDPFSDNIWLRRWPLRRERSHTFSVPSSDVECDQASR